MTAAGPARDRGARAGDPPAARADARLRARRAGRRARPGRDPYADLDGFRPGSVAGHAGALVLGRLGGQDVAIFAGRSHVYERIEAGAITTPVRTLKALGAELLVLTNAAGSLRSEVGPGSLVALSDHINLLGFNPLTGPNDDSVGPRFPSLARAYDPELRERLHAAADVLGTELHDGVYLAAAGPSFETPAEIRAFRTLGADLVGMSTVPEVIAARHAGLRVAAISAVTNLAEGMGGEEPATTRRCAWPRRVRSSGSVR